MGGVCVCVKDLGDLLLAGQKRGKSAAFSHLTLCIYTQGLDCWVVSICSFRRTYLFSKAVGPIFSFIVHEDHGHSACLAEIPIPTLSMLMILGGCREGPQQLLLAFP